MGVDDVPDQYEDLANYKVGAPQPEPLEPRGAENAAPPSFDLISF